MNRPSRRNELSNGQKYLSSTVPTAKYCNETSILKISHRHNNETDVRQHCAENRERSSLGAGPFSVALWEIHAPDGISPATDTTEEPSPASHAVIDLRRTWAACFNLDIDEHALDYSIRSIISDDSIFSTLLQSTGNITDNEQTSFSSASSSSSSSSCESESTSSQPIISPQLDSLLQLHPSTMMMTATATTILKPHKCTRSSATTQSTQIALSNQTGLISIQEQRDHNCEHVHIQSLSIRKTERRSLAHCDAYGVCASSQEESALISNTHSKTINSRPAPRVRM
ncbi:AAEL008892-PA [Aedes aegypti]|uniref:AAEL008892-PA n=1 Tax=Aedes aegypti TaxID=7159 RepID=Q16XE3_AEDAE|nr:AAEL008892-PA [Aedes aegypti]